MRWPPTTTSTFMNAVTMNPNVLAHFRSKRLLRAWKDAADNSSQPILIFSPYLTSTVASTILASRPPAEVHTRFEVELFASGSSSLSTLRSLIDAGHALFHVPDLHAKVFLDRQGFVTVGSQNLTHRGSRNREVTALFNGADAADAVAELVDPWLADRSSITGQMIDEMERLIGPTTQLFAAAKASAQALQDTLDATVARWEAERAAKELALREAIRRAFEDQRLRAERLLQLRNRVASLRQASASVSARIERQQSGGHVYSLVAATNADLTRWIVDGKEHRLERAKRYLCIDTATGKLGWARVMTTRITYFESGLVHNNMGRIAGLPCTLNLRASRHTDLSAQGNLEVTISLNRQPLYLVNMWYAPGTLTRVHARPLLIGSLSERIRIWLEDAQEEFQSTILRAISTPFKYENNLGGDQANSFFSRSWSQLRLALDRGNPVLIASAMQGS